MDCPRCGSKLKKIPVSVAGATSKVISHQCPKCDYFKFDQKSGKIVLQELKRKRFIGLG